MKTQIRVKKEIEISKKDFQEYEKVRISGECNMFNINHILSVNKNLTREKIIAIIENYEKLLEEYPNVNKAHAQWLKGEVCNQLK